MATKFNHCPNCRRKHGGGFFSSQFYVYECRNRNCRAQYCHYCGDDRCPNCASKDKRQVGYVNN